MTSTWSVRPAIRRCSSQSSTELDDALDWLESLGVTPVVGRDRQPAGQSGDATTRATYRRARPGSG